MSDDRVTAELDEIRERYAARPGDVERLLAVADAVLKLPGKWQTFASSGDAQDECADELREAITAALLGAPATHQPSGAQ